MKRPSIDKDIKKLAKMLEAGMTHAEVRAKTGWNQTRVVRLVRQGRECGAIPPRVPPTERAKKFTKMSRELSKLNIKRGCIQDVLDVLPPDVHAWLLADVPKGASLAIVFASIIVDAYHEESGRVEWKAET